MDRQLKLNLINDVSDIELVSVDEFWNYGEKELAMHKIHAYPAKFPAFITTKALEYYVQEFHKSPERIADIFCGCGTVALEVSRKNIPFWGCDINPVATLIAKTKSSIYKSDVLRRLYKKIINDAKYASFSYLPYDCANVRIRYWYEPKQYDDLSHLLLSIRSNTKNGKYRWFFECAFSNILKSTSRWLTKSIKPQVDPNKISGDVFTEYEKQFKFMLKANDENIATNPEKLTHRPHIERKNVLTLRERKKKIDLIITSPPYVTSYEYADLHQLSSIWLGYTDDYRTLRSGSIGSNIIGDGVANRRNSKINGTGLEIVTKLKEVDKSRAISVENYFHDMEKVVRVCQNLLSDKGMVLFVIGDTEYKGVKIKNSHHLATELKEQGFDVYASKRKITGKLLTPYRDARGKFTTDSSNRQVYNEEYIIIGERR